MKKAQPNSSVLKKLSIGDRDTETCKIFREINNDLKKVGKVLEFAKEDIDLYAYILSTIVEQETNEKTNMQARKFLARQYRVYLILTDLINRHQSLKVRWKPNLSPNNFQWQEIIRSFFQLEEELRIFHEIHFLVKRNYLRFTHEHFQVEYGQPVKVA